METIVAAALRLRSPWRLVAGGYPEYLVISAPPPARHHSLLHPLHVLLDRHAVGPDDQGFLTSAGRYVGREQALQVALAAGQPLIEHASRHATQLFSEDLW